MLQQCKFKNFDGYCWIETYEDHEEDGRCYVYDEDKRYKIDYISVEHIDKISYDMRVESLLSVKNIEEFIEWFGFDSYDISSSPFSVMKSAYDEDYQNYEIDLYSQQIVDELEHDWEWLKLDEFCTKYFVHRIGDQYFYLGED